MDDIHIHTCSYYCEYPACIKRQRDDMREKLLQQHEWVGLTEEDKESFWTADQMTQEEWSELFGAVEAKLKEKNNG